MRHLIEAREALENRVRSMLGRTAIRVLDGRVTISEFIEQVEVNFLLSEEGRIAIVALVNDERRALRKAREDLGRAQANNNRIIKEVTRWVKATD